jgi:cellulose synthase/poly-beta-1,6-N-acetylglucosamine synthase-like glycosyltransferase
MELVALARSVAGAVTPPGLPSAEALGTAGYLLVLLLLAPFGLHRLRLVWLAVKAADDGRGAADADRSGEPGAPREGALPTVTVQIPVYNEANVVARAIDAACRLDWPRDRLEVQVLDDSTDATASIAARRVEAWRERGVDARHVRREGREGYKAGALAAGVRRARGEYFLVLDADFVPPRDLLRRLVPAFGDPEVGFVQAAWSHVNEDEGWLTRGQALLLDGHFAVEHRARHGAGLFFNFNGTAGMWRRSCLEDVGGWSGETLTEDLELSYRAQMAGWKGVYRDDVRVPGELPSTLRALEVQQQRWTRGGLQTARRVLPDLWRDDGPLGVKLEATGHLLGHLLHPVTLALALALAWPGRLGGAASLVPGWVHGAAITLAVIPFLLHYGVAAAFRGRGVLESVPRILQAVALGIGLGPPLTAAAWRGATDDHSGTFRRTPKTGRGAGDGGLFRYALPSRPARTAVRGVLAAALGAATLRLAAAGAVAACLFTALFAGGYLFTALSGLLPGDEVDPGDASRSPAGRRAPGADAAGARAGNPPGGLSRRAC